MTFNPSKGSDLVRLSDSRIVSALVMYDPRTSRHPWREDSSVATAAWVNDFDLIHSWPAPGGSRIGVGDDWASLSGGGPNKVSAKEKATLVGAALTFTLTN